MANLSPPNAHAKSYAPAEVACYVVTDIETDGPQPGHNSMLSFASVATDATGKILNQFEACLNPLDGAVSDPNTLA